MQDEDQPILFKFLLYMSQHLYEQDLSMGVQSYAIEITPKLLDNTYTTLLPEGQLLILGMAIDALGAYTNFTQSVVVMKGASYKEVLDTIAVVDEVPLAMKLMHLAAIPDEKEALPTEAALHTLGDLSHSEKKAVYALKASGMFFKGKATLDAKLEYVEDMQNQFRKEVATLLEEISGAQQAVNGDLGTGFEQLE